MRAVADLVIRFVGRALDFLPTLFCDFFLFFTMERCFFALAEGKPAVFFIAFACGMFGLAFWQKQPGAFALLSALLGLFVPLYLLFSLNPFAYIHEERWLEDGYLEIYERRIWRTAGVLVVVSLLLACIAARGYRQRKLAVLRSTEP